MAARLAGAEVPARDRWAGFLIWFAGAWAGVAGVVLVFALVFDPFGVGPLARPGTPVLMDLNQRYMYPQVVRSGRFDAAVFGTSTVRLLDPTALNGPLDARFANLAMNSATAWEQTQIFDLFLRHTPAPKGIVWGLDPLWCEADATSPGKRLTPIRPFPVTFYDENRWNDWPELFNLKALEIAWRMMLYRIGAMPERYRIDGYEVFTPPESTYDLARARGHLWGAGGPRAIVAQSPAFTVTPALADAWPMPALAWLDERLARVPASTPVLLMLPPNHVAAQPIPGSEAAARADQCKQRLRAIATRHGAGLLDFQRPSAVTTDDQAYWDPLHYRLAIARRIEIAVTSALTGPRDAQAPTDGFWAPLAVSTRR